MPRVPLRTLVVLPWLVASCSGASSPQDAGFDAMRIDAATEGGAWPAVPAACAPRDAGIALDAGESQDVCVRRVQGRVVDQHGGPVADRLVTFCSAFACFYGRSDGTGAFVMDPGEWLRPSLFRVLGHGRPTSASLHVEIPPAGAQGTHDVGDVVMPVYGAASAPLPSAESGGTAQVGAVTLTFAAGTRVELDLEDVTEDGSMPPLRVAEVSGAALPAFARTSGLGHVYALAPFDAHTSARVAVQLDNADGFAAGARVEFVAVGTSLDGPDPDAGRATVVALGHVRTDGRTLATDPGEGIAHLTWIGARLAR